MRVAQTISFARLRHAARARVRRTVARPRSPRLACGAGRRSRQVGPVRGRRTSRRASAPGARARRSSREGRQTRPSLARTAAADRRPSAGRSRSWKPAGLLWLLLPARREPVRAGASLALRGARETIGVESAAAARDVQRLVWGLSDSVRTRESAIGRKDQRARWRGGAAGVSVAAQPRGGGFCAVRFSEVAGHFGSARSSMRTRSTVAAILGVGRGQGSRRSSGCRESRNGERPRPRHALTLGRRWCRR